MMLVKLESLERSKYLVFYLRSSLVAVSDAALGLGQDIN